MQLRPPMQLLVAFIECCKAPFIYSFTPIFFLHLAVYGHVRQPEHHLIVFFSAYRYYIFDTHMISGHEIAALRHAHLSLHCA